MYSVFVVRQNAIVCGLRHYIDYTCSRFGFLQSTHLCGLRRARNTPISSRWYLQSTRLCGLRPQSYINVWLVCTDFVCRISSPVKDLPYRVYNWRYNNDLHCIVSILGRQVALKTSADVVRTNYCLYPANH